MCLFVQTFTFAKGMSIFSMTASPKARLAGLLVVFAAIAAAARAAAVAAAAVAVVVPDELHPPTPCQLAATVAASADECPCRGLARS